jgi:integrase
MATKRDFTDRFLKAIKPALAGKRVLYWDAQVPGFGVRLTDKSAPGTGSFVLMTRYPGSPHPTARHIGDYPAMTLAQAREIARGWRDDLRLGIDPKIKIERQRAAEAQRKAQTFKAAWEAYDADKLVGKRSRKTVNSVVRKHVHPAWADRSLRDITRADAKALIRKAGEMMHANARRPVDDDEKKVGAGANRLLTYLKTFGKWAVSEEFINDSPFVTIARPTEEKSRDRTLSDTEVRMVWQACGEIGVFGRAFQVMLLTGQRRTEVGAMRWSEIDLKAKTWTIPAARSKNKRAHEVPLSDAVIQILTTTPRLAGSPYVFSTGRRRNGGNESAPISGWGRAKESLDRLVTGEAAGAGDAKAFAENYGLHDFRRTVASGMAAIGIAPHVVDAALNHKSGTIKGVAAVYNRYSYASEMRSAFDRWSTHLLGIVDGTGDNVVDLAAARAS